jgi:hypothetical protein
MYLLYNKKSEKRYTECVKLSIPLLIRLLEYAHESAGSDVDLHWILERIIAHSDKTLTMEHYQMLIPDSRLVTVEVGPGQKVEVEPIKK